MRTSFLAAMMTMAASTAGAASSIDLVKADDTAHSIDYIRCPACAPLKTKKAEVPEVTLKPGTQKIEIKEVDGVLKVYRTEAWLGGSPVTYVSKASTDLIDKQSAEVVPADDQKPATVAIDKDTTSAVSADMSGAEPAATTETDSVEIGKDATVVEKDTVSNIDKNVAPQTADMSDGASAKVEKPNMVQKFNPQDLQLRIEVQ